jgi:hypothetical protein
MKEHPYPPTSEPTTSVASPVTASLVAPIPVPTHGTNGTFSLLAKTRIRAPPSMVLSILRNSNTWAKWNTVYPRCVIYASSVPSSPDQTKGDIPTGHDSWLEVGTVASVDFFIKGDGLVPGAKRFWRYDMEVTVLEAMEGGYRIAWMPKDQWRWNFHSERVVELVETGNGGTEYTCWETFGGAVSKFLRFRTRSRGLFLNFLKRCCR